MIGHSWIALGSQPNQRKKRKWKPLQKQYLVVKLHWFEYILPSWYFAYSYKVARALPKCYIGSSAVKSYFFLSSLQKFHLKVCSFSTDDVHNLTVITMDSAGLVNINDLFLFRPQKYVLLPGRCILVLPCPARLKPLVNKDGLLTHVYFSANYGMMKMRSKC